jgi:hypothetical protein
MVGGTRAAATAELHLGRRPCLPPKDCLQICRDRIYAPYGLLFASRVLGSMKGRAANRLPVLFPLGPTLHGGRQLGRSL